ncbi:unnamed protein product [Cochlearia groenlandica]
MAKSLLMVMLISVVIFKMSCPTLCQEIDEYSEQVPEDVAMSPNSELDIYFETPDESPYADSPATKYDEELMDRYTEKQLIFIEKCIQKTNNKCGDEVFKDMLNDEKVSDECCLYLLKLGKDCHVGMVRVIFSTYEYKHLASKAIPKSKETWNSCVRRVGNKISVPVSLEK